MTIIQIPRNHCGHRKERSDGERCFDAPRFELRSCGTIIKPQMLQCTYMNFAAYLA